ncbi:hypothetical protein [Parasutterella excrementihominis]
MAEQHPELVKKYYGQLADTSKDERLQPQR